jgi:hypothetical protein
VVVNDEDVVWQQSGKAWQVGLPVEVQALVKATVATAGELLEALLDDVTAAIETEDRTLGGLVDFPLERGPVRSLPREAGSLSVGVAITYTAKFKEGWGHR